MFVQGKPLEPSLMIVGEARSLLNSGAPEWEGSELGPKLYNYNTIGLCYKTFCGRNEFCIEIIKKVCHYQSLYP
jgi:hypothetical protein